MKAFVIFGKKATRKIIFLTAFIFIGMNVFSKNYFLERQKNDFDKINICQIKSSPNPSDGKINLELNLQNQAPATLTVTNIIGQTIFQKK